MGQPRPPDGAITTRTQTGRFIDPTFPTVPIRKDACISKS